MEKRLSLSRCTECEEIRMLDSYVPLANICGINLTSLTNICVKDIDGLECLPDWLFCNNQNLSELQIHNFPKLRGSPNGLHTLNSLEVLNVLYRPNLKSIAYPSGRGRSASRCSLQFHQCQELMDLPHEMVES